MSKKQKRGGVRRRAFLQGTGTALVAATAAPGLAASTFAKTSSESQSLLAVPRTLIDVTVNGRSHRVEAEDRWTLAEMLRDHLNLTGTKIGCDRGECGACTVLVDGKAVYACSSLAVWFDGRAIRTVEGLADNGRLDPLQQAFIEHHAPQCGFCTAGQLMAAKALLDVSPAPSAAEVRAGLAGNLCRCANYNAIVEAVVAVSRRRGTAAGAGPLGGE